MSDVAAAVENFVSNALNAATKDLLPLAEAGMPLPIEAVLKGLLALPPVQSLIAEGTSAVANAMGGLIQKEGAKLEAWVQSEAKAHPALAHLFAIVEAPAKAAANALDLAYGPTLRAALQKILDEGRQAELETFFKQIGVL
jgi:hypothetical protein